VDLRRLLAMPRLDSDRSILRESVGEVRSAHEQQNTRTGACRTQAVQAAASLDASDRQAYHRRLSPIPNWTTSHSPVGALQRAAVYGAPLIDRHRHWPTNLHGRQLDAEANRL